MHNQQIEEEKNQLKEKISKLSNENNDINQNNQQIKETNDQLQLQINKLTKENNEIKTQKQQIDEEKNQLQTQIENLNKEKSEIKELSQHNDKEKSELQDQMNNLKEESSSHQQIIFKQSHEDTNQLLNKGDNSETEENQYLVQNNELTAKNKHLIKQLKEYKKAYSLNKEKEMNQYFEIIKELLFRVIDIEQIYISGRTILHYACETGNAEFVKYIISLNKIDVNSKDEHGKTILHSGCESGNLKVVKYLLSLTNLNIDVNAKFNSKYIENKNSISSSIEYEEEEEEYNEIEAEKTALHIAVENKSIDIVQLLLSNPNIDVNAIYKSESNGSKEKTALHIAVENKSIEIVQLLLSNQNIDINAIYKSESNESNKKTALHIAVENKSIEIVQLLLSNPNIDVNALYESKSIITYGYEESIEKTALHIAIENKSIEIVQLLLSNPRIDIKAKYKYKSLKKSFNSGNREREEVSEEKAALHISVENNCIEIVQLLLTIPDIDINAIHISISRIKYIETYSYYTFEEERIKNEKIKEETALNIAVENKNIEIVQLLISNPNIDINAINNIEYTKKTSLHVAVENQSIEIVQLLLSNSNIDINAICEIGSKKMTALHIAVENKSIEIAQMLISNSNIDINAMYTIKNYTEFLSRSRSGKIEEFSEKTALHIAVENKSIEIIQLLLNNPNINVNAIYKVFIIHSITIECDNNYRSSRKISREESTLVENTALNMAVGYPNIEIVQLLINNPNIDINSIYKYSKSFTSSDPKEESIKELKEYTTLHIAVVKEIIEIVEMLLTNPKIDINIKNEEGKTAIELAKNPQIRSLLENAYNK